MIDDAYLSRLSRRMNREHFQGHWRQRNRERRVSGAGVRGSPKRPSGVTRTVPMEDLTTEQEQTKQAIPIGPGLVQFPTRACGDPSDAVLGMLITILCMNRFTFAETDRAAREMDCLIAPGDQVHLDPALGVIPYRLMPKIIQVEISARLAIQSSQK